MYVEGKQKSLLLWLNSLGEHSVRRRPDATCVSVVPSLLLTHLAQIDTGEPVMMDSSTSGLMGVEHRESCLKFNTQLLVLLLVISPVSPDPMFLLKPGESLRLDLNTSDPVEVYFKRNDTENILICTVGWGETLFDPQYKTRLSVSDNSLVLNGVRPCDSGVYTVREHHTGKINSVYSVTVNVDQSSLQLKTDESVRLDLFTSVPVEVILSRTHATDSEYVVICTVENHKPDCLPQYKTRVSVSNKTLVLNGVIPSDSGVYTVREKKTNETIGVYNVTVSENDSGESWLIPVCVVVILVLVGSLCCFLYHRRKQRENGVL